MTPREWDDAQQQLFLELVKEGVPTLQIARVMARTKNAIIGKAHRLMERWPEFKEAWEAHSRNAATLIPTDGKTLVKRMLPLPSLPLPSAPVPPILPTDKSISPMDRKRFIHPPSAFVPKPEVFSPPPSEGVRIVDLTEQSCRYMIGDRLYCGDKIYKMSYCEHHYDATRIAKVN
jgi:hypothetical protein